MGACDRDDGVVSGTVPELSLPTPPLTKQVGE
jgi:hypothetical protein